MVGMAYTQLINWKHGLESQLIKLKFELKDAKRDYIELG